jgi:NAD-dependent dihydropyrimidine dehydrogenase PreA subunit
MTKWIMSSAFIALLLLCTGLWGEALKFEHSGSFTLDAKSSKLSFSPDSDSKVQYRVLLAPKAALDSLGITSEMLRGPIQLNGQIKGSALIVQNLLLGETVYHLRGADYTPLWTQKSDYKVSTRECISCRLCPSKCPVGAISMVGGKAVIDQDKCTECGICREGIDTFRGCPVGAIKDK